MPYSVLPATYQEVMKQEYGHRELPAPSETFNLNKGTGPFIRMCPMPGTTLDSGWISSELCCEERGLEIVRKKTTGAIGINCVLAGRTQNYIPILFIF